MVICRKQGWSAAFLAVLFAVVVVRSQTEGYHFKYDYVAPRRPMCTPRTTLLVCLVSNKPNRASACTAQLPLLHNMQVV